MIPIRFNRQADPGEVSLVAAGGLLLIAGVAHAGVWAWQGGSLAGPVSVRKPILFCLASGVTCLSIAWVYRALPRWRVDHAAAWLLSATITAEVALICLQQWRGVPSHFNGTTPFDARVLLGIKAFVGIVTAAILYFSARTIGPLRLPVDHATAARGGMAMLVVACLIGFAIEWQGERLARDGLSPSVYGKAGVLKFPHGMPLHALQYLPATAWLLRRLGVPEHGRLVSVWSVLIAITGLTVFALIQCYAGRARFDLTLTTGLLLAGSVGLLLLPLYYATTARRVHRRSDT